MRKLGVVIAFAGALALGAVAGQPLFAAASTKRASAQAHASLASRVTLLERKFRIQVLINANLQRQIGRLQNRGITVTDSVGGSTTVAPRTWGTAISGSCLTGTPIGTTFSTNYPAEMGVVTRSGEVHVFNPYTSGSVLLSVNAICASIG